MKKSILLSILFLGTITAFEAFGADLSEIEALAEEHISKNAVAPRQVKRPSKKELESADSGIITTEALWRLQKSKRNKNRVNNDRSWTVAELEAYLEDKQRALLDAEGVTLKDILGAEDVKVATDEPSDASSVVTPVLSLPFIVEMIERRKANKLATAIDKMPAGALRALGKKW